MAPLRPSANPILDAHFGIDSATPILSDLALREIVASYVASAELAADAGFDFVDVKACHGYLLHELIGSRSRPGPYGGDFLGRTRMMREIIEGIRRTRPGLDIGVRLSVADLLPHGAREEDGVGTPRVPDGEIVDGFGVDFDLAEPIRLISLLRDLGVVALNVTLGSPYYCPHLQRPAAFPPSDGYLPPEDPLHSVAAHLHVTAEIKQAFPDMVIVGTGYSYLQEYLPGVAQHEVGAGHVDSVGIGRMVLSYPELPADVLAGRPLQARKICRTFSDCTTAPRSGILSGCFPLDRQYKEMPEAERLREIKTAMRKERGR